MTTATDSLARHRNEMSAIIARARAASRSLTDAERARFDDLEVLIGADRERVETEERSAAAATARSALGIGGDPASPAEQIRVGAEERTYRKGGGHGYFQDLAATAIPGSSPMKAAAEARLARHGQEMEVEARAAKPGSILARSWQAMERTQSGGREERSGLTTTLGNGGAFLPPAYLLEAWIAYPRQSRVLADLVRKMDLPKGPMTINIPKIVSSTQVAPQNGQNTPAVETDLTDAYVSAPVVTWAGNQTASLQAVEQSAIPYDEIIFSDLKMDLDRMIENDVMDGSGTAGHATGLLNTSGITTVTYTSASPTAMGAWPYIGQAKAKVFDSIFRPADAILMTPDRWAWFEIARDANNRPLVLPAENNGRNLAGVVDGQLVNGSTPVGRMFGLPVYVTTAIPTNIGSGTNNNEDEIVVASTTDLYLWESAPVARALPQVQGPSLSIVLQVYEYGAFMAGRLAGAASVITGTGLSSPVFS